MVDADPITKLDVLSIRVAMQACNGPHRRNGPDVFAVLIGPDGHNRGPTVRCHTSGLTVGQMAVVPNKFKDASVAH